METVEPDQAQLRQLLLGTLPEAERLALEDRFVDDGELFALIGEAEDDLTEAYARGELRAEERKPFETGLLSVPEIRRRAELMRTMQVAMSRTDPVIVPEKHRAFLPHRFWRYAGVAAIVLILAGIAVWWLRNRLGDAPLRAEIPQIVVPVSTPAAPPVSPPTGGNPETPKPQPSVETPHPAPPTTIATLVLAGGLTRSGGGSSVLALTPQTTLVRVELTLDSTDFSRYRATLFDADGRQVWRSGPLAPRGPAVTTGIPARSLRNGDYRIALEGYSDGQYLNVDNYVFSVRSR